MSLDFEKAMQRLEEIVSKLESGEMQLEESLHLYEEGMKLTKLCQDKLSKAERKVYILKNSNELDIDSSKNKTKSTDDLNQHFDLFNDPGFC